eukprot:GDKJ01043069.1.p1 GENE.GDKJ01043069.1~~GDKJ01043069.1.p1  ORF type:complete len:574 (+),score=131.47 GDKJ01043069.1:26-1723(+)
MNRALEKKKEELLTAQQRLAEVEAEKLSLQRAMSTTSDVRSEFARALNSIEKELARVRSENKSLRTMLEDVVSSQTSFNVLMQHQSAFSSSSTSSYNTSNSRAAHHQNANAFGNSHVTANRAEVERSQSACRKRPEMLTQTLSPKVNSQLLFERENMRAFISSEDDKYSHQLDHPPHTFVSHCKSPNRVPNTHGISVSSLCLSFNDQLPYVDESPFNQHLTDRFSGLHPNPLQNVANDDEEYHTTPHQNTFSQLGFQTRSVCSQNPPQYSPIHTSLSLSSQNNNHRSAPPPCSIRNNGKHENQNNIQNHPQMMPISRFSPAFHKASPASPSLFSRTLPVSVSLSASQPLLYPMSPASHVRDSSANEIHKKVASPHHPPLNRKPSKISKFTGLPTSIVQVLAPVDASLTPRTASHLVTHLKTHQISSVNSQAISLQQNMAKSCASSSMKPTAPSMPFSTNSYKQFKPPASQTRETSSLLSKQVLSDQREQKLVSPQKSCELKAPLADDYNPISSSDSVTSTSDRGVSHIPRPSTHVSDSRPVSSRAGSLRQQLRDRIKSLSMEFEK